MRVVSLVPSVTETLLAWGITPVACTRFCEQPDLPHVGGTKDPDVRAIIALAPDLVVLDDEENRREDHDALVAAGVPVHVTHVRALDHVGPTLAALATRVGAPATPARPTVATTRSTRRVFVPIWRRPWMTMSGDTYGSALLAALGLVNVFADDPVRYPTVELDEVARRAPQMVLLPSEPYPFKERHVADLRAVAPDVRLVDGRDLFWWGTRTPDALARLAQATKAE